jgi:hypothetical protein
MDRSDIAAPHVDLAEALASRRWLRRFKPFPHLIARDVFRPDLFDALERQFEGLLALGLASAPDGRRLSKNMRNSDAYSWNFTPEVEPPFALFYSRAWHDLLRRLMDLEVSPDVNAAAHHHQLGSRDGHVHCDLGEAWFSDQPYASGVNPMDLSRCPYTHPPDASEPPARHVVRAATMIFYLCNGRWREGDGGETGLYAAADDPVDAPAALTPPIDNSLVVFETSPASHHAFLRNRKGARNSVILWLHAPYEAAAARWGGSAISPW